MASRPRRGRARLAAAGPVPRHAADDRASFRRFCGFAAHEPTPERTAFVRFRRELVRRGLDRVLFEAVPRQLKAKGVMVRTGTLVDATLIPSASIRSDGEARWAGHRRRKPVHGYKAYAAPTRVQAWCAASRSPRRMSVMRPSLRRCCRASRGRFMVTVPSA
ncbi:transposase, partial [Belnapia sp. T6]|nr:transposase [Belnapia mucosa]